MYGKACIKVTYISKALIASRAAILVRKLAKELLGLWQNPWLLRKEKFPLTLMKTTCFLVR